MEYSKTLAAQILREIQPSKSPNWAWCYCFVPALIGYFLILMHYVNEKPPVGNLVSLHPDFYKLIGEGTKIEMVTKDILFSEGPLWINDEQTSASYLLFSDIPRNRIYRWEEGKGPFTIGKSVQIDKSGCYSNTTRCELLRQPGSNALILFADTNAIDLVVCQHGERSIAIFYENGTRFHLATHYHGRPLNSPNDVVWSRYGDLYFTDPYYGLLSKAKDGKGNSLEVLDKHIPYSGIYMIKREAIQYAVENNIPTNEVILLSSELSHPNGLAFSIDHKKLYVANSSPDDQEKYWSVFDVLEDGSLANKKIFFNASELITEKRIGTPDGMKVDKKGNLFASAPGGVVIISSTGKLLGRLFLPEFQVSNVAFGDDGYLYLTTADSVLRVKTLTKPSKAHKFYFK
mmetsp:Transcript_37033/g.37691  ORF Transcript_37033/g.37691 Transcript_37033/m.37691 type:complete len:402 (+) Transcript_37033:75-1280(+)